MSRRFVWMVLFAVQSMAQAETLPTLMPLGKAWASNSVNAVVFRQDPITTHNDRQYAAYYDAEGAVIIASRTIGEKNWTKTHTALRGNVKDAHNSISIIADGDGFLHIAWDHHGHPLRYTRSRSSGVADFEAPRRMTEKNEQNVTYPQFLRQADGSLIFLFRDGASGQGNLAINRYDVKTRRWEQLHANLVSGEGQRNAYWQACIDRKGAIHLSWVWRETGDVATNHDVCYARSNDSGRTWQKSDGSAYRLPITAASAEIASPIPQKHELINQTSMCADDAGRPIIATYFRSPGEKVVQYFVIHHDGKAWKTIRVTNRATPFSLSGDGSKQIPISRPQVIARREAGQNRVWLIFRDEERDNRVSLADCPDLANPAWTIDDLTDFSVSYWEPSFDHVRWQRDGVLNLYVQRVGQGDGEGLEAIAPQPAHVLEWTP